MKIRGKSSINNLTFGLLYLKIQEDLEVLFLSYIEHISRSTAPLVLDKWKVHIEAALNVIRKVFMQSILTGTWLQILHHTLKW